MYAKLVFPYTTTTLQKIRDISRIIHESSSGSANLSNLEFIDTTASELYPGVNSGWSLATGSIPAKGTAISTDDREYIFQCSCVDTSKTKHLAITLNGLNTNTNLQNSSYTGVLFRPIIDYGTATEVKVLNMSSTNTTYSGRFGVGRYGGAVYIFATSRRLILAGYNEYGFQLLMHLEFDETGQTQFYNLIPQAYLFFHTDGGSSGRANQHYNDDDITGEYKNSGGGFLKSLYANDFSNVAKLYYFTAISNDTIWQDGLYLENGTTFGQAVGPNGAIDSQVRFNPQMLLPPWNLYTADLSTGGRVGQQVNASNRILYPLFPLYCSIDSWCTGIISFKDCNVFMSVSDIGVVGDNVKIGNDDYIVFAEPGKTSTLIKKE